MISHTAMKYSHDAPRTETFSSEPWPCQQHVIKSARQPPDTPQMFVKCPRVPFFFCQVTEDLSDVFTVPLTSWDYTGDQIATVVKMEWRTWYDAPIALYLTPTISCQLSTRQTQSHIIQFWAKKSFFFFLDFFPSALFDIFSLLLTTSSILAISFIFLLDLVKSAFFL